MGKLVQATITVGNSLSAEVSIPGEIVAIRAPAGMEGLAITFQSATGLDSAFADVMDSAGSELSIPIAADEYLLTSIKGLSRVKVRTGTSAIPVSQVTEDAVIGLVVHD